MSKLCNSLCLVLVVCVCCSVLYLADEKLLTLDLAKFVEFVKPQLLVADHYPYFDHADKHDANVSFDTKAAYRANLESLRTASIAAGVPFWNFFHGAAPFGSLALPTEA